MDRKRTQRKYAHILRSRADAIMIGIDTVLTDNPSLNVRLMGAHKDPIPVVLDSKLRTPLSSNLLRIHKEPIIATTRPVDKVRQKRLQSLGAKVITVKKSKDGGVDLKDLINRLGEYEIMSLLIEGGSTVAGHALKSAIVDKITFFYAPKIVGSTGLSMIGDLNIQKIKNSIEVHNLTVKRIGKEFMVEGYIDNN